MELSLDIVDGNHADAGRNADGVVGADGQNDHLFPATSRKRHAALVEGLGEAVSTGATASVAAADNIDFVTAFQESAGVIFQVGPGLRTATSPEQSESRLAPWQSAF